MQGVGAVPIDIVVIGASGTGKTRLIKRFLHGSFADEGSEEPNTGAVYYSKTLALKRYTYKFKIWDTAGAEKYQFLLSMYYSSSKAAMICFDPLMQASYERAKILVNEVKGSNNIKVIFLVSTKLDQRQGAQEPESSAPVDPAEIDAFVSAKNILFVDTSAKTGQNVKEVFGLVAEKVVDVLEKECGSHELFLNQFNVLGINSMTYSEDANSSSSASLPSDKSQEKEGKVEGYSSDPSSNSPKPRRGGHRRLGSIELRNFDDENPARGSIHVVDEEYLTPIDHSHNQHSTVLPPESQNSLHRHHRRPYQPEGAETGDNEDTDDNTVPMGLVATTSPLSATATAGGPSQVRPGKNPREELKARRPTWAADGSTNNCHRCSAPFTVFLRKHHCRSCGDIFCADCSSHFITIPQLAYHKPVRVCVTCHKQLLR